MNDNDDIWEFDERRREIVENLLQEGETLSWVEVDKRLREYPVKKELRKNFGGDITFYCEDPKTNKCITVGTYIPKNASCILEEEEKDEEY